MTNIPQLDTATRMGRKPIKRDVRMKQFTHWLDPEAMARVEALVGRMKISEFMRSAVERELKHRAKLTPSKGATEGEQA